MRDRLLVAETEHFGWWTGHALLEQLEIVRKGIRERLGLGSGAD